jgi:hypothetical protein
MSRTLTRYVEVEVEVDLDAFDTDDLRKELASRKDSKPEVPGLSGEETHPLHEIYYAFKFGLTDRAMELARAYVCDELGVIL